MEIIVEVCTGGYTDCMAAAKGGAQRVELNSALSVGGLTPSTAVLKRVKRETDLKVICMVRPRAAGFCYDETEFSIMMDEAKELLDAGADGIAFGFLHEDAAIHLPYTKAMIKLIHQYGKEAVFHRAFDVVKDPVKAMEQLIECGVDRLLTSGQQAAAMEGAALIRTLQQRYGDQIEILAGSGVNEGNVKTLLEMTGICQVHSSCKAYQKDPTTKQHAVSYSYLPSPHEYDFDVVDEQRVKALIHAISE